MLPPTWRSHVLDKNVYDIDVRVPGKCKNNIVSDNSWPLLASPVLQVQGLIVSKAVSQHELLWSNNFLVYHATNKICCKFYLSCDILALLDVILMTKIKG